jgi:uncharacterized YccA/Bax inhibitor family protein
MRTSNPALGENTFRNFERSKANEVMTIQGTVNKTGIMLAVLVACAFIPFKMANTNPADPMLYPMLIGSSLLGFVVALVMIFKQELAPVLALVYAGLEGVFLGTISGIFNFLYAGIVFQAILLTAGTLFALLAAYRSGLIKATENFKLGIVAATGAIAMFYLINILSRMVFGFQFPMIHDTGLMGIGFSLVVVVIAALNLVLDFDFIEQGEQAGAPKYMEWYAAFGLMVTLVWLYLEILRLLAKLQSRD